VRFWQALSFTETGQLIPLARTAEEVGFHGVLVSDHVFFPGKLRSRYPYSADGAPPFGPDTEFPEPWAAVSAMAAVTTRLRFNSAVYLAPLRHPLEVARAVATAAVLSGGRVALGAGVGWIREEYEQLGRDFHTRGRRLDEMIGVLRRVWAGGMVEHHGRFYDFDPLQLSPAPPGPIPIYVGGASPAALRRAARLGDGWLGSGHAPDEIPALVQELARLRREAGREREPFDFVAALTAPPDPDLFRRLEDRGVTSVISYPPAFTTGPGSSLAGKRAVLERYADAVIARVR
jgi:probable F420-dependent oxidoreductase